MSRRYNLRSSSKKKTDDRGEIRSKKRSKLIQESEWSESDEEKHSDSEHSDTDDEIIVMPSRKRTKTQDSSSSVHNYTLARDGKMNLAIINMQELRVTFSFHLERLLERVPNPDEFAQHHRVSAMRLNNMHNYRQALVEYLPELFYVSFPGIGKARETTTRTEESAAVSKETNKDYAEVARLLIDGDVYEVGDYVWIHVETDDSGKKEQDVGKIIGLFKSTKDDDHRMTVQWTYTFETLPEYCQEKLEYQPRVLTSHTQDLSCDTIDRLVGSQDNDNVGIRYYVDFDVESPRLVPIK